EVLGTGDRVSGDAGRPRPGGEVGVVGGSVRTLVEGGSVFPALEIAVLEVADRAPGEVVPHDPDDGNVVFDRGAQDMGNHGEAAVAANGDADAVGCGKLRAEDGGRAEAHA